MKTEGNFIFIVDGETKTREELEKMDLSNMDCSVDGLSVFYSFPREKIEYKKPNDNGFFNFIEELRWTPCVSDLTLKLEDIVEKPKNYNSTRHKYNPNSEDLKFSRNIQDALQRAEEYQAQFGRKKTEEAERFNALTEESLKDDVITNSSRGEKEMFKETEGKLYYELSWEFIEAMAQRMQNNKNGKYELYNWKNNIMTPKGIEDMKQAINRHHIEVMKGNYNDGEEFLGHIVSYATNSMILWEQLNKS